MTLMHWSTADIRDR